MNQKKTEAEIHDEMWSKLDRPIADLARGLVHLLAYYMATRMDAENGSIQDPDKDEGR